MTPRLFFATGAVLVSVILAGCSSSPSPSISTSTSTSTTSAPTTTTTAAPSTTSPPSTTTLPTAQNLPVTDTIRAELLQAGAALNSLPASDYTGLQPGMTYYSYDPVTKTYWAGAALAPSPSSLQAQVSAQDDGSYMLFSQPAGGSWTAYTDGTTGEVGSSCPAPVPASVLALWGWATGTCRPTG